ncbi:MAG: hypothetical protein ACRDY7_14955 [Acidimicrobiia bacterium]
MLHTAWTNSPERTLYPAGYEMRRPEEATFYSDKDLPWKDVPR